MAMKNKSSFFSLLLTLFCTALLSLWTCKPVE